MDSDLSESITDSEEGSGSKLSDAFSDITKSLGDIGFFSNAMDNIVETVLLGSYFTEHFQTVADTIKKPDGQGADGQGTNGQGANGQSTNGQGTNGQSTNGQDTEQKEAEKSHALDYELEYLVSGKKEDRDNLLGVVNRLLLVRTICNVIYLYTDGAASGKARATATGLVGFTCFEPLISLTKTMILIAWGYMEALVDTCALLQNYEVPLMKKSTEFTVKYEDLLQMNKNKIQEKAGRWEHIGNGVKYEDYMQFFLLMVTKKTKCYRALDLIQENTNLEGEEKINMGNALFGIEIKGECSVSMKFLRLPFINRIVGFEGNSYPFVIETETAY